MIKNNFGHKTQQVKAFTHTHTHTHTQLLPLLEKLKNAYLLWDSYYQILPKRHRYSLGLRTDDLFVEIIEMTAVASYSANSEKQPYVRLAIRKLDTLKILLMILWEAGSLQDNQYIALSLKLDEIGKNLGGWNGQIIRQNSPGKPGEKR